MYAYFARGEGNDVVLEKKICALKKSVPKSRQYIVRTQIDFLIYLTVRVPKRTVES